MSGREAAAFYTRYADWYDRIASDTPLVGRLRERVVDALDPHRGDVVVEMGCGTGANLGLLRERVGPGGTVIGLDVSTGVLTRARERIDRADWENVHVARADATRPPLRSGAPSRATAGATGVEVRDVDGVLATFLTGMLDDPAGAVDDWCRLVAAGSLESAPAGRVCVAGLARSTRPVGRLLNPLFAAGVRTAAPPSAGGHTRRPPSESAVERLDRRALAAHRRVHDRCPDARTTQRFAGFARITAGSVPANDDAADVDIGTDADGNADTDGGRRHGGH